MTNEQMLLFFQDKLEMLASSLKKVCDQLSLLNKLCYLNQVSMVELDEALVLISARMNEILQESRELQKLLACDEGEITSQFEQLDKITAGVLNQFQLLENMDVSNTTMH